MSLQGSLRQLGLADVLQGALAGRRGNLHLRHGTSRALLHLDGHTLRLVSPDTIEVEKLIEGLIHRGVVDGTAYLAASNGRTGIEALDALLADGSLERPAVDQVLRGAAEDGILDLLTWQSGDFRFREGDPIPETAGLVARIGIDMGGVLLRAAQRLDERRQIADRLGLDAYLFFPCGEAPGPSFDGDPIADVHALLDGIRTVDEVALFVGVSRFVVLRSVLTAIEAGAARPPTDDELRAAAEYRSSFGEPHIARQLLLQWAGRDPTNPEPIEHLVELARRLGHPDEEADSLLTLGHVHLQTGAADRALPILRDLNARRPGDPRVLSALANTAEALGDVPLYGKCMVQLAEAALAEDEPERTAQLLVRVVAQPAPPLIARVLRGRAFVALRNRDGLLTEAEAVLREIGKSCKTREHTEAAAFFRDALASLTPERTDLIRQYRGLGGRRVPARSAALVGAVVALLAVAGFVFWPGGPGSLLADAEAAAAAGNTTEALRLIAVLAEEHPDAPETAEAWALQARLRPPAAPPDEVASAPTRPQDTRLATALTAYEGATARLPAADATEVVEAFGALLRDEKLSRQRKAALARAALRVPALHQRLEREVRLWRDRLALARQQGQRSEVDADALRPVVELLLAPEARGYGTALARAVKALEDLFALGSTEDTAPVLRALGNAASALDEAWSQSQEGIAGCRRHLARADVENLYAHCRADASRFLVEGRLDDADACYAALSQKLADIAADPDLAPLSLDLDRRRIPAYLSDRRSSITEIREALAGGQAAEAAGHLDDAVTAYASVARKFWQVRFENVIRVPLRVTSVPTGAKVCVNGKEVGATPILVHYPWATQVTLSVEAEGYERRTHVIASDDTTPCGELQLALPPAARWEVTVDPTVSMPPLAIGSDVLVCSRSGRVQLHDGVDGRVRWARDLDSLEGIRARPAFAGGLVYLPFVDGTVWMLDAADGRPTTSLKLGRTAGGAAVLVGLVAIPDLDGRLAILEGKTRVLDVRFGGRTSAGVIAAHGAFWLGTADGRVVRIDRRGSVLQIDLPGRAVPVRGLAPFAAGLLVTRADGTLHAIDAHGRTLWAVEALGDIVGTPAATDGLAACADSRGHVLLFDLADGAPRGQVELTAGPLDGLLVLEGRLAACLKDGRVWIHDPGSGITLADVDLGGGPARFSLGLVGSDAVAAPAADGRLRLLAVPRP